MEYSIPRVSTTDIPKLKTFQTIQKSLIFIGIDPKSALQTYPFNAKTLLGLSVLIVAIAAHLTFLLKDATELVEYTQPIFVCCDLILIIVELLIWICTSREVGKIFRDCECLVNDSKRQSNTCILSSNLLLFSCFFFRNIKALKYSAMKSTFYETNQSVEKMSKIVSFVVVKLTPLSMLPTVIYIFFLYYTTDVGSDAFKLLSPMW